MSAAEVTTRQTAERETGGLAIKQAVRPWLVPGTDSGHGKARQLPLAAHVRAAFDEPWDAWKQKEDQ